MAMSVPSDPLGLAFDESGKLYVADTTANVVYLVPPGGGAASTFVALADAEFVAFTPLGCAPNGDFSGSQMLSGGEPYDLNCFYGHVFHDQGGQRATGGNHYQGDVVVEVTGSTVCVIPPSDYVSTGVSVNGSFIVDVSCATDDGGRFDPGIDHIGGTNGTTNFAAVVADEPAAAAEAGFALGKAGGTFGCAAAGDSQVRVSVPANVVADGTRFLCAANENAQSAAAPIGYSLVGSRVNLTTDTGLVTFDSALTVCLSHTVADILKAGGTADNLRVGFFDGVMWQPLPVTSANANETCGMADHFTQFGLMAATPTALPATGASVAPVVWWVVLTVVALASIGVEWRRWYYPDSVDSWLSH